MVRGKSKGFTMSDSPLTYDIRALNFCGTLLTEICHSRGYTFPEKAPYEACRVAMGNDADLPLIQSMPEAAVPSVVVFGEAGFKAYMAANTIADYYCPAMPPPEPTPEPVKVSNPAPAPRPKGVPPPLPDKARKGWKTPPKPEGNQKSALPTIALTSAVALATVGAGIYVAAAIKGGAVGASLGGPIGAGIGIFACVALTALAVGDSEI